MNKSLRRKITEVASDIGAESLVIGEVNTRSFYFLAVASSVGECKAVMLEAMRIHAKQTGADVAYMETCAEDANYLIIPNRCAAFRDGNILLTRGPDRMNGETDEQ